MKPIQTQSVFVLYCSLLESMEVDCFVYTAEETRSGTIPIFHKALEPYNS
jgi:hypothetical protein